jgi:hypothetical protein
VVVFSERRGGFRRKTGSVDADRVKASWIAATAASSRAAQGSGLDLDGIPKRP